jgi:hypothetical protein
MRAKCLDVRATVPWSGAAAAIVANQSTEERSWP